MKYKNLIYSAAAILALAIGTVIFSLSCTKEDVQLDDNSVSIAAAAPCDSLKNVEWGDTLRVVKNTITSGKYKGKTYWQAMLSSNNIIEPTRFQNIPTSQRVVIADTTEIKYTSVFIVARIK